MLRDQEGKTVAIVLSEAEEVLTVKQGEQLRALRLKTGSFVRGRETVVHTGRQCVSTRWPSTLLQVSTSKDARATYVASQPWVSSTMSHTKAL